MAFGGARMSSTKGKTITWKPGGISCPPPSEITSSCGTRTAISGILLDLKRQIAKACRRFFKHDFSNDAKVRVLPVYAC